jgi:propionyl-CoA synthetase
MEEVRRRIGAIVCLKKIIVVERLPKTRSGKILRKTLRSIANGDSYSIPATIDDPDALLEVEGIIRAHEHS